ncbi:MAG: hypothetical protein IIB17_11705 [Chloroflexi bacterium]|nr:hypothetical protein [Chloroflexota bacterium]
MGKIWMIGGGAALALLLIVSVVVALLESEESFAADTPEGAVQSVLRSIEDEDFQAVYTLLSADLKERCSIEQIFGSRGFFNERFRDSRITHEDTTTIDSTTVVTIRISTFRNSGPFGDPFGTSEYSYEQRYTLRQEEGQWRFVEYPWPLFNCSRHEIAPLRPAVVDPTPVPTPVPTPPAR